MKLFLSGGGTGKDSEQIDRLFVDSVDKTKPVLYIPIAINTEKHPYPDCLKWILEQFQNFGFNNFVMWTEDELRNKTAGDFDQFGGIYIGGGNTFKLLKQLKEFGTFEILQKLAKDNVPIYGGSAGAIILARTVIPALSADPNDSGVTDFSALNLLHGYDIWCHYKKEMDTQILKYMKDYRLEKIIAVPESAGLFVTETSIQAVGPDKACVFKNKMDVISSGEFINDKNLSE